MAVFDVHFYSDVLQVSTAMSVIIPQRTHTQIGLAQAGGAGSALAGEGSGDPQGPAVLYLLHGLSDDESIWLRRTSIDRYASERGLAVVMPRAERSFYHDEVHGSRYWTFLSQELPEIVHGFFRLSNRREETFVAGLSMGGYGAMRWALAQPWRFAAAASLSGALDLGSRVGALAEGTGQDANLPFLDFAPDVRDRVFGGSFRAGGDDDLMALLGRAAAESVPPLWVSCGLQDGLLAHSQRFEQAAVAAGVRVHAEYPDGTHEWGLWDAQVRRVIDWLPLP